MGRLLLELAPACSPWIGDLTLGIPGDKSDLGVSVTTETVSKRYVPARVSLTNAPRSGAATAGMVARTAAMARRSSSAPG